MLKIMLNLHLLKRTTMLLLLLYLLLGFGHYVSWSHLLNLGCHQLLWKYTLLPFLCHLLYLLWFFIPTDDRHLVFHEYFKFRS